MKKIKWVATFLAFAIVIAGSSFQSLTDTVWFEVDSLTGEAINPTTGGKQGVDPVQNCTGDDDFCATSLSILEEEVIDHGNGTFGIATGVDITSIAYYEEQRLKN